MGESLGGFLLLLYSIMVCRLVRVASGNVIPFLFSCLVLGCPRSSSQGACLWPPSSRLPCSCGRALVLSRLVLDRLVLVAGLILGRSLPVIAKLMNLFVQAMSPSVRPQGMGPPSCS